MPLVKCRGCGQPFLIRLTLEVMALADEPHVKLCLECERARNEGHARMRREVRSGAETETRDG